MVTVASSPVPQIVIPPDRTARNPPSGDYIITEHQFEGWVFLDLVHRGSDALDFKKRNENVILWRGLTQGSALAWAALRARDLAREGTLAQGTALRARDNFMDIRNDSSREPQTLVW